jgi:hypothetical protein
MLVGESQTLQHSSANRAKRVGTLHLVALCSPAGCLRLNAEPNWELERCVQQRRKADDDPVE